ncbi:lysophospholipid acyltransferase family protein [Sedimenticola hydrogenitrophicus]|uniref:lysophospholipid acyltransferase family protein n=1 Tax=Sedimenticola hydrogenitrophicus TaxID=2967975 RepID=UPI0023AFD0FD|nr:lysophospholipid acyltransferase family protein [Sedimenticola hydrogenitrophicus]
MKDWPKLLFFTCIVRPLVLIILGLNIRHRQHLPATGPAIVVANHNSHLDTLVLMSLFPLAQLQRLRPVAAADYFMANPLLAWFATRVIGIIPIERKNRDGHHDPLAPVQAALEQGDIIIIFPEGTRGQPERMQKFKSGVIHLAKAHATAPIIPVFLHGLGKSLPKGEGLLVPFFCDVFVGPALYWQGDRTLLMQQLEQQMEALASEQGHAAWD